MGIGSGLGGSFGVAAESTYGTYAAPTKFFEVQKSEIKKTKTTVQGGGLAAGRMSQLASRRVQIAEAGTGSVDLEVTKAGFGLLLSHIFGGGGTPTQVGVTTAYLQSHTLADNVGKSLTAQNGVPDTGGTVRPYTGKGGKVTKASFQCATTDILKCMLEVDFQKVDEGHTLAAPSYTSELTPFHGGQMRVRLGTYDSETAVDGIKGITLDFERPQDTERNYASVTTPLLKDAPIMNDYVKVSGSLDLDYVDKTEIVDLFGADTDTAMVIEWVGDVIEGAETEYLAFRLPATFFDDTIAVLAGPGIVTGSIPFVGQLDLTNGVISCDYISTDTAL